MRMVFAGSIVHRQRQVLRVIMVCWFSSLLSACGIFSNGYSVKNSDGEIDTLGKHVDAWLAADVLARSSSEANLARDAEQAASQEQPAPGPALEIAELSDQALRATEVAEVYRKAYELIDDPVAKNHILQRLAALDLKTAENLELAGLVPESAEAYAVSIAAYSKLLEGEAGDLQRDELLYALAKAYALTGDSEKTYENLSLLVEQFPESVYWPEAQFRRGEHLFVNARYDSAEQVFSSLVVEDVSAGGNGIVEDALANEQADSLDAQQQDLAAGIKLESREFQSNTLYMLGWSQFKNSRYDAAVDSFVALLDYRLLDGKSIGSEVSAVETEDLSRLQLDYVLGTQAFDQPDKLADDALRAVGLALAYTSVDAAIENLAELFSNRPYAHSVYAELAELFFAQERLNDSAQVYAAYEMTQPNSNYAPWFSRQNIAVLQHAGFSDLAREQKALFSERYHPLQTYYLGHQQHPELKGYLDTMVLSYVEELASFEHARARLMKAGQPNSAVSDTEGSALAMFERAAYWYRKKIDGFPFHPELGNTYFLLAESLDESDRIPESIESYELAAYGGFGFASDELDTESKGTYSKGTDSKGTEELDSGAHATSQLAGEAGYAAILGYRKHMESLAQSRGSLQATELDDWREKKIESSLMFADTFSDDSRREAVLASVITDLQETQNWDQLLDVADTLLAPGVDSIDPRYSLPTLLASAAASYELERYQASEQSYASVLDLLRSRGRWGGEQAQFVDNFSASEMQATIDNYASSIYKQAEVANASGNKTEAIDQFNRLVALAPTSQLRVSAQRDAIVLHTELEQWQSVLETVPRFLSDFPGHVDTLDMQRRLLNANVAMQDWRAASMLASSLATMIPVAVVGDSSGEESIEDASEADDLRYASAEYALKAGDKGLAIERYQDIINNSATIDEELYETHYRIAELYGDTGNRTGEFNQYRLIRGLQPADAKRSDRAQYIVADAQTQLAEVAFNSYQSLSIREPLMESLALKRASLEKAVAAYDEAESYAVEKFALLATQRKASIYADFATAIMESERPAGLDELALEEYDFLLEEQAYPFEEQAIELYEVNVKRAWDGMKSPAITDSYKALEKLLPARYKKQEILP